MSDDPEQGSGDSSAPKKRRVPVPRKKSTPAGSPAKRRVPAPRVPGAPKPHDSEIPPVAQETAAADSVAQQQAAAQQAAAQQAAAQQAAAQQAAAQQAAAQQAAKQQAAAQQAAAQQAAAQKAAAQAAVQQAAVQQAAQQMAAKKAAALRAAQQAAAGSGSSSAAAASSSPPTAPSKRGRPVAAPTRKYGAKKLARRAALTGVDGSDDTGTDAKSRMPWFIIGGSAVVVLVVLGFIYMGDDPPPVVEETQVAQEPEVDLKEIRENQARAALDRVEKSNGEDPTDRIAAANRLAAILLEYANTEAGREAGMLREQLMNEWRTSAEQSWTTIKADVRTAFRDGKFETAAGLLDDLPKIFDGASSVLVGSFHSELRNLRKDAKEQFRYMKRLDELSDKAGLYARKGYEDIAIAIIEALPERVQDDAPDVWRMKEELVKTIQREGLSMLLSREQAQDQELAEVRRLEAERKKAERELRWRDLRDSVPWTSLLARTNLYNWVTSSDRPLINSGQSPLWRVVERDGFGVMVGDNRSGNDIFTGVFSNHWEDYVCEFELSLKAGSLRISPRSQSRPGRGGISEQTSPMLELGEDFPKNRWVKVTLEVHGDSVLLQHGDAGTELSLDPETTRLPATGGFVFWISDGTRLEIRDVRVKLVSDTRDGGIFAK